MRYLLYDGNKGYSSEATRVKRHSQELCEIVKRQAAKALNMEYAIDAANELSSLPFELWDATNGFGDKFEVLYLKVPTKKYLELEREAEGHAAQYLYHRIAIALRQVGNPVRFIEMEPNAEVGEAVTTPQLQTTSSSVERALGDFEALVSSKGGTISGVDRIHTALHGYLRALCDKENIPHTQDADIAALFQLLRRHHPKLQHRAPQTDAQRMLRGLAQVVDALNPLRNHSSMAHPNEDLLEEPEATLAVNAVRTLLHYLDMKLR